VAWSRWLGSRGVSGGGGQAQLAGVDARQCAWIWHRRAHGPTVDDGLIVPVLDAAGVAGDIVLDPGLTEARAREVLASTLEPFLGDDGVCIPGAHWLVTAARAAGVDR
jgi:hypothetical protein